MDNERGFTLWFMGLSDNAKLYDHGDADEVLVSEAERNFCGMCGSFL